MQIYNIFIAVVGRLTNNTFIINSNSDEKENLQMNTKIKKELSERITKVEEGSAVYLNAKEEAEKLRKKLNDLQVQDLTGSYRRNTEGVLGVFIK